MGTFGGPNSYFFSAPVVESVNNRGTVVGGADTGLPDPYAPNCFVGDCDIAHAFQWKNGFLTDLGTLPAGYSSTAYWINDKGLIMGGSENGFIDPITGFPEQIGVVWLQNGEIVDLGTLGGNFSFANAMNNRGEVVGIALNTVPDPYSMLGLGTQTHAFIWRNGYMEDLGTLGGPDSWGSAVNERGQVVGWAYINSTPNTNNGVCAPNVPTQDPFLWENGRTIDLGTFGGTCGVVGSFANAGSGGAINSRGQIIGTSNLAGNQAHHAFLWNEGALSDLGTLGGDNSEAYWINDAGEIVGRADVGGKQQNHHAFLWKNGRMRDLGKAKGWPCSTAIDINSKGQVIIDTGICGVGGGPGLLWENGALYDLNTLIPPNSGFVIGDVNYINDRGEIAVTGVLPNGDQHALLLVPVDKTDDSAEDQAAETQVVSAPIHRPSRLMVLSSPRSRYGLFGHTTSSTQ
jgi:probable HAF family extracellular repeat protein